MLTLAEVQVPRGRRTLRLAGLMGGTVTSESQEHAENREAAYLLTMHGKN